MNFTKTQKSIAVSAGAAVLILGLLWFFQEQGLLKVFPTDEDRGVRAALRIDESKFKAPVGVSEEGFRKQIAEAYARRAMVKKNKKDVSAWFAFGYQLNFLNDHEGAVRAREIVFRLQPENHLVAGNLASNYQYFLKDYAKAEFYYDQALTIQPAFTDAWKGLADLYRFNWKEKNNLVEPLMLEAIRNDSANESAYLVFLVSFFAEGGDFAKAGEYYARVRSLNPSAADDLLETYPGLR